MASGPCNEEPEHDGGGQCGHGIFNLLPEQAGTLDPMETGAWTGLEKMGYGMGAVGDVLGTGEQVVATFSSDGAHLLPIRPEATERLMVGADGGVTLDVDVGGERNVPCEVNGDGQPDLCLGGGVFSVFLGPVQEGDTAWATYFDSENAFGLDTYGDFGAGPELITVGSTLRRMSLEEGDHDLLGTEGTPIEGGGALSTGDADGDGDLDLVISEWRSDSFRGSVRILVDEDGALAARELLSVAGQIENQNFGAVTLVADFDGDGAADLAVGAPGRYRPGVVYVFPGPLSPSTRFEDAEMWRSNCPGDDRFGNALAVVDTDGDGSLELAVGARYCRREAAAGGAVFVIRDPLRVAQ